MRFWIRISKETKGPFTPAQIRAIEGVNETTLVCPETATNASDWKRLRDVPELIEAKRKPPPLPIQTVPSSTDTSSQPDDAKTGQRGNWLAVVSIGGLIAIGLLVVWLVATTSNSTPEAVAQKAAEDIVRNNLQSPATMKIIESKLLDQKEDRYLATITVDAQNGFGAMIRSTFLVVLKLDTATGQYSWDRQKSVQQVLYPPQPADIAMMKALNDWK